VPTSPTACQAVSLTRSLGYDVGLAPYLRFRLAPCFTMSHIPCLATYKVGAAGYLTYLVPILRATWYTLLDCQRTGDGVGGDGAHVGHLLSAVAHFTHRARGRCTARARVITMRNHWCRMIPTLMLVSRTYRVG
jgi:hypothetical protein